MKKIKVYLESSALWNLYYEEKGSELVEYCLNQPQFECLTSIWSQLEIERGIKKRENQNELTSEEAENLQIFIETDNSQLINKKKLTISPILDDYIVTAKKYIRNYNLYASDALHLASATIRRCKSILVDDYHFKRLDTSIENNEGIKIFSTAQKIEDLKAQFSI